MYLQKRDVLNAFYRCASHGHDADVLKKADVQSFHCVTSPHSPYMLKFQIKGRYDLYRWDYENECYCLIVSGLDSADAESKIIKGDFNNCYDFGKRPKKEIK